jgi:hypothetical protein
VTVDFSTVVMVIQHTQSHSIYPNPSSSKINYLFEASGVEAEISMFNIIGEKLFAKETSKNDGKFTGMVDISELPTGGVCFTF